MFVTKVGEGSEGGSEGEGEGGSEGGSGKDWGRAESGERRVRWFVMCNVWFLLVRMMDGLEGGREGGECDG